MLENERVAVKEMAVAYNTNFAMQDEDKTRKIKEKFMMDFTVDVTVNPYYVVQLLENAYSEKNADDVEYSLSIGFMFNLFSKFYSDILCKLIEEDWHFSHENIASIFQELKLPETVDCLYKTVLKQFKYLEYDEFFALAVKCIWALGEIRTAEAKEKLKLLTQSNNKIIKENALMQLERIHL